MPIDRGKRDALADVICQWQRSEIAWRFVADKIWENIEPAEPSAVVVDRLLEYIRSSFLILSKTRDGERLIISEAEWEAICDYVVALRSNIDLSDLAPLEPASMPRIVVLVVWTIAVFILTVYMVSRVGGWGWFTWAIGPIPYVFWWWRSAARQSNNPRPFNLYETEYARIREMRQLMTFPRFDPDRFKPTRRFIRERRKEIVLTALAATPLIVAAIVTWPFSAIGNLRQGRGKGS